MILVITVSIPERVLGGLEPIQPGWRGCETNVFQSLKGFWVVWNPSFYQKYRRGCYGFNP